MILVDNRYGLLGFKGVNGTTKDGPDIEFNDIKIFGESESPDCPENGGFCYKNINKVGLMSSVGLWGGKAFMET